MTIDKNHFLEVCNSFCKNTLMETLEIEFVDMSEGMLRAKMPVNPRVHQPAGLLHGGATVALAESVGSSASFMYIDVNKQEVRGIEIAANHIKSMREGTIYGTARIIHKGRTLHLWEIRITDEKEQLISVCKITNIIIDKR